MFIPVRSAGGGLTGKAAFQAARFRRVPIANWQHWDWQHFHIGYILRYILPGATKIARQLQKMVDGVSCTDLRDGWLARNLFFISKTRPLPRFVPESAVPARIRAEVLTWKDESAAVRTVPADEAALAVFNDFNLEIHRKMLKADKSGDETNYLYGKALENARRVALILAVGRDARQPSVTGGDAVYACALVRYLVDDLIRAVRETVAETGDEKAKKRILQVVASAGRGGITKKELTRRTQFIRKSFRDEYLDDLVEGGELTTSLSESGGTVYRLGR